MSTLVFLLLARPWGGCVGPDGAPCGGFIYTDVEADSANAVIAAKNVRQHPPTHRLETNSAAELKCPLILQTSLLPMMQHIQPCTRMQTPS